ncbi:UNVERIFIED_CONTAM: hypothetical protein Q9R58_22320 [Methylobacteriaceae bacterium AG10]|nr:hypothetical protein [Methylobacteriaceae bacterium AG10]
MVDSAVILAQMRAALAVEKTIVGPLRWNAGTRPRTFALAALAEHPIQNLELHLTAAAALPNEHVGFQLCLSVPGHTFPVTRFDWRPPRPHVNKFGKLKGIASETGLHPFEANAELGLTMMVANNLPVCVPVTPEPPDFPSAVAYVCDTFRLRLRDPIPLPPWSPTLI